jgi:hypothetical protein
LFLESAVSGCFSVNLYIPTPALNANSPRNINVLD